MRPSLLRDYKMPLKACCNAHHVEVAARDIFATRNPLKSQPRQNLKSPFSNIRAVISKLWQVFATDVAHARGTSTRPPSAVSSLGGFRTPALTARTTVSHWAGIRKPSQKATFALQQISLFDHLVGER